MNFGKGEQMGGFGSGLPRHLDRRSLTTDLLPLDVSALAHLLDLRFPCDATCTWTVHGEVVGSAGMQAGAGVLVLSYQFAGPEKEWSKVTVSAPLVWSRCTLGGERPWFLCPEAGCGRRVAILYCGANLLCRRCLQPAYPSQLESAPARAHRRAGRIRQRIEERGGSLGAAIAKRPKGMHHETFNRLWANHNRWMALYFTGETKRLEALSKRLETMVRRLS
jgi:hypothetical protein